ncbi:hypothetical protein QJU43_00745 [Pasteurella atlantica]|uniref:Uncharacterized protein n=3 Tax=Pasteurellaceae TaxID=712 RepID=A0AAJ6P2W0_9PAST|nr:MULTISPECIES: hypothetical protein [Pasteurella]MDP8032738.1 hypothetical protein [Pasteurella atlantica]MDP8034756.1 hypothetical protein [Pasteurella atlantica]MDP8036706.1 hypothetical protein [Pasteurella atlantica]MDP8046972.1 hypothetical protein [Pasteurella atlantica]MDP8048925.1 hypothetical protein [Pasteurella atlantica]
MKKLNLATLITGLILLFSTQTSFAEPNVKIHIDNSSETNTISISKKKTRLCWDISDLEANTQYDIVEEFTSPPNGYFDNGTSTTVTNSNKTKHTLLSKKESSQDGFISNNCWYFSKEDPLGDYTLTIKVNGMPYSNFPFKLTK